MSWFIDQTVNAVLQLVIAVVIFMTNKICQPLGFSPQVVLTYFPGISTFTQSFKILSLFILILIVLFQLTKNIFNDFAYSEKDNPIILVLRSTLAIVLIMWSLSFMSYLYNAIAQPFYLLKDDYEEYKAFDVVNDEDNIFRRSLNEAFTYFIESAESISEDEYDSVLESISDWIFPGKAIITGIIELIAIAVIGYKLIFFLIEILERYLILMVQTFTSPLIWSTIVSHSTIGIFKKWLELFVSNVLLMYLDMWMLGIIVKAMSTVFNPDTEFLGIVNWQPNFILGVFLVYAMIRIAQSLDTYLGHIMNTVSMGRGLMHEMFMTLHSLQDTIRMIIRPTSQIASGIFEGSSVFGNENMDYENQEGSIMENHDGDSNDISPEYFESFGTTKENTNRYDELLFIQNPEESSRTETTEFSPTNQENSSSLESNPTDSNFVSSINTASTEEESLNEMNESYSDSGFNGSELIQLSEESFSEAQSEIMYDKEKYNTDSMDSSLPYQEFLEKAGIDENEIYKVLGEEYYLTPNEVGFEDNGEIKIFGENEFTGENGIIGTLKESENEDSPNDRRIQGNYKTYDFYPYKENSTESNGDLKISDDYLNSFPEYETSSKINLKSEQKGLTKTSSNLEFKRHPKEKYTGSIDPSHQRYENLEYQRPKVNSLASNASNFYDTESINKTESETLTFKELFENIEGHKEYAKGILFSDHSEEGEDFIVSESEYFE